MNIAFWLLVIFTGIALWVSLSSEFEEVGERILEFFKNIFKE